MKHFQGIALLILMILLGLSYQVGYAQIQPDLQLDTVSVSLLPEYIQPTVLVVYEIILNESLPLPQEFTFEIPADAVVLNVINFTPNDRPFELVFQETSLGNWKVLHFTATNHHIRIEYQDPNLVKSQHLRSYDFRWLSIYPVSNLIVYVRQPLGAGTIHSEPHLENLDTGVDGNPVVSSSFGNIPAGELFSLSIEYHKDPSDLSYPALSVSPASPIEETSGRAYLPVLVILWMLLLSVAIIIVVVFYYLGFRKKRADQLNYIGRNEVIINPERLTFFCQECGMRTGVDDNYCRNCGTELLKPTPFEQPPNKKS